MISKLISDFPCNACALSQIVLGLDVSSILVHVESQWAGSVAPQVVTPSGLTNFVFLRWVDTGSGFWVHGVGKSHVPAVDVVHGARDMVDPDGGVRGAGAAVAFVGEEAGEGLVGPEVPFFWWDVLRSWGGCCESGSR